MSVLFKLCLSIIKRNKGFTICILLISILSVAIGFLGANFGISSEDTINTFIKDSSIPDAIYVTDIIDKDKYASINNIEGIKTISSRFIYDTSIETKEGNIFSIRIYREDSNSLLNHTIHQQIEYEGNLPKYAISYEFARYNDINVGDIVLISTEKGKSEAIITSIISNPETLNCVKDNFSSYEGYQFGYMYVNEDDFNKVINLDGLSNQLLVYFNEQLDSSKQKKCMEEIHDKLDPYIISETLTQESEELKTIRDDLDTISVICKFVPGIIWLISLGFYFIFIKIIVDSQRKTIGLLRALGFSIKKVVSVFLLYTILINIFSLIIGSILGYKLLEICVNVISNSKNIINPIITILPIRSLLMSLVIFVIGIIVSLFTATSISKIDPSEAYGGIENITYEPPEIISKFKINSFVKISIVSIIRNYKRQIVGILCICACIISMCIGLEGYKTIRHPIDEVYGNRYRYDLMIRNINQDTINRINNEIDEIVISEPEILFTSKVQNKDIKLQTIEKEDKLTVLKDSKGNEIWPNEGIIIDEMYAEVNGISIGDTIEINNNTLKVDGIAREILHTIMYVNKDTANKLNYNEENCLLLKLNENVDINSIEDRISNINKDAYFVEFSSQKTNINDAFISMSTVMFIFAIIAFLIGSLLVINFTIIDFNENKNKYAILLALGTPINKIGIVSLIVNTFEVTIGMILATPLSYICNSVLLKLLSSPSQQYVMVDYDLCFIISCLLTLFYVVFSELICLYKISRLDYCRNLNEME